MKAGLLYMETDKKKIDSEIQKGDASVGVDLESLYDQINFLEVQHNYDHMAVVIELKKAIMLISGRAKAGEPQEDDQEPEQEQTKEAEKDGDQR